MAYRKFRLSRREIAQHFADSHYGRLDAVSPGVRREIQEFRRLGPRYPFRGSQ
jgi:hypothetical protein